MPIRGDVFRTEVTGKGNASIEVGAKTGQQ